jgi:hypothetical protein
LFDEENIFIFHWFLDVSREPETTTQTSMLSCRRASVNFAILGTELLNHVQTLTFEHTLSRDNVIIMVLVKVVVKGLNRGCNQIVDFHEAFLAFGTYIFG